MYTSQKNKKILYSFHRGLYYWLCNAYGGVIGLKPQKLIVTLLSKGQVTSALSHSCERWTKILVNIHSLHGQMEAHLA